MPIHNEALQYCFAVFANPLCKKQVLEANFRTGNACKKQMRNAYGRAKEQKEMTPDDESRKELSGILADEIGDSGDGLEDWHFELADRIIERMQALGWMQHNQIATDATSDIYRSLEAERDALRAQLEALKSDIGLWAIATMLENTAQVTLAGDVFISGDNVAAALAAARDAALNMSAEVTDGGNTLEKLAEADMRAT